MDTIIPRKRCYVCTQTKPLSEFKNNRSKSDGKSAECKVCANAASVEWQKKGNYTTKHMRMAGLSREDYNEILEQQNHKCAICGKPETYCNQYGLKKLAVDHDHVTGKFRGLLCQSCNTKLAVLENAEFVHAAQEYLKKHSNLPDESSL